MMGRPEATFCGALAFATLAIVVASCTSFGAASEDQTDAEAGAGGDAMANDALVHLDGPPDGFPVPKGPVCEDGAFILTDDFQRTAGLGPWQATVGTAPAIDPLMGVPPPALHVAMPPVASDPPVDRAYLYSFHDPAASALCISADVFVVADRTLYGSGGFTEVIAVFSGASPTTGVFLEMSSEGMRLVSNGQRTAIDGFRMGEWNRLRIRVPFGGGATTYESLRDIVTIAQSNLDPADTDIQLGPSSEDATGPADIAIDNARITFTGN